MRAAGLVLVLVPSLARADVSIDRLVPALADTLLVCSLETTGLPGAPSKETLTSGLPSALVVAFTLLDGAGRERASSRTEIRIEPDLWENLLVLRTPFLDHRLESLDAVEHALASLGPLPVAPASALAELDAIQVRARIAVHPLAPAELTAVRTRVGGSGREERDRREVSIGLGALVRYFLSGVPDEDWVADGVSSRVSPHALPRVSRAGGTP